MSIIAEFTLDPADFTLGSILCVQPDLEIDLERLVPTGKEIIPYFWVSDGDLDGFERHIHTSPRVNSITLLDTVGDSRLYRIEWEASEGDFVTGLTESKGTIQEAYSDAGEWFFRVRFPDHDRLARFYNYCLENNLTSVHLERVFSLTERSERAREFGLTGEQREAVVLAAQQGYFASPREVTLTELADELGITQQALSQRLRGALEKIVLECLGLGAGELD